MKTGIFHNGFIKFVPRWISFLSLLVIIIIIIKIVTTAREFTDIININDYYVDKLQKDIVKYKPDRKVHGDSIDMNLFPLGLVTDTECKEFNVSATFYYDKNQGVD